MPSGVGKWTKLKRAEAVEICHLLSYASRARPPNTLEPSSRLPLPHRSSSCTLDSPSHLAILSLSALHSGGVSTHAHTHLRSAQRTAYRIALQSTAPCARQKFRCGNTCRNSGVAWRTTRTTAKRDDPEVPVRNCGSTERTQSVQSRLRHKGRRRSALRYCTADAGRREKDGGSEAVATRRLGLEGNREKLRGKGAERSGWRAWASRRTRRRRSGSGSVKGSARC
jgi:hypothetical protein